MIDFVLLGSPKWKWSKSRVPSIYKDVFAPELKSGKQSGSGEPFGCLESFWYPQEHPMFRIKTSNAMALNLDFPLIIVRYPYTYRKDSNAQYVNQFAVKMLTDVQSGIAPVEWQSYEGPVLAYRPQIDYEDAKHFNRFDFEVISKPDYFGFQNKSTSQA